MHFFNFNTEEREKVDNEVVQKGWGKQFVLPAKKRPQIPVKAIQFLANHVVVSIDSEFEHEIKTDTIRLDLFVPRRISAKDDTMRQDVKDDIEKEFNPLKRKRNFGTVISIPKTLTNEIKIYQIHPGSPAPQQYISGEDAERLDIPYNCGGWKPSYVTCADIVPEVQVGDKVYFHFLTIDESNRLKGDDGGDYYKLRYNNIFCVVRDENIIPIGGFVLLQPAYDEGVEILERIPSQCAPHIVRRSSSGLIVESNIKPKAVEGIVRHIGTPLIVDTCEIKVADLVSFELNADFKMEIEGKEYYVIPYRDILGKI